jgi:cytidine deaminase
MIFVAKERAYCPYSKFRVGACVKGVDGMFYTGCNVENASYGIIYIFNSRTT